MRDSDDPYVDVELGFLRSTEKAVLLLADGGAEFWVPRSVLSGGSDKKIEDAGIGEVLELKIREWFARKSGIAAQQ